MKYKQQHYVSVSYLSAWTDRTSKRGPTPHVWRISRDGTDVKARAPKNIFWKSELYTGKDAAGQRDTTLEENLHKIENDFVRVRRQKIQKHLELEPKDIAAMVVFTAAQFSRTPQRERHHKEMWGKIIDKMDGMVEHAQKYEEKEGKPFRPPPVLHGDGPSMGYEDVKRLADDPIQNIMPIEAKAVAAILAKMSFTIWGTTDEIGFITSDAPVVVFDPEWYKRPPMYQAPGLGTKTVEVTLPVSPEQLVVFHWLDVLTGYQEIPPDFPQFVDEYNRRTRFQCDQYFVSRSSEIKETWFDPGEPPPGFELNGA